MLLTVAYGATTPMALHTENSIHFCLYSSVGVRCRRHGFGEASCRMLQRKGVALPRDKGPLVASYQRDPPYGGFGPQ